MTREEFEAKLGVFRARAKRDCKQRWRYRWGTKQWHSVNQWPPRYCYVSRITGAPVTDRLRPF